jgi:NAD(P)H-nitrite reductase large subunit
MNSVEVFGLPTISVGLATADDEDSEVLRRADDAARIYRRIVLRDGRVVGALFVGDIARAGILTGLIRERVDVSGIRDLLLSDEFGLISLPAEYRKHVVKGEGIVV